MRTAEHFTSAPWLALTDRRNSKGAELPPVVIYAGDKPWPRKGAPIATVNVSDSVNRYTNARLISTAPDGYALALAVVEYFGDEPILGLLTTDIKLREMARAIVAKVAGTEPQP